MTMLESWKGSLSLFKWSNLKTFLSSVWAVTPTVYAGWLKYCAWMAILIACALPQFLLYRLYADLIRANPPVSVTWIDETGYLIITVAMIVIMSVLLSYAAMLLYVIVKQAIARKPQKPFGSMKHNLWGGALLALVVAALLYWLYLPVQNSMYIHYETLIRELLASYAKIEHLTTLPSEFYMAYKPFLALALVIANGWTILGMLIVMLFFLQSNATLYGLGKSIRNTFLFVVYNLPGLLVMGAVLFGIAWLAGLLIQIPFAALDPTVMASFMAVGIPIISVTTIPIFVIILAQYFCNRMQKQLNLYE